MARANVSTLTRRESRVRPPALRVAQEVSKCVSTLTRRESRVRLLTSDNLTDRELFQPSPGAKAGCDPPVADFSLRIETVSTLTRRESRVRPQSRSGACGQPAGFNPHPARKPGATGVAHSALGSPRGFNPHPARKPGATAVYAHPQCGNDVSTLTRRESRVRLQYHRRRPYPRSAVSPLTRRESRVRPPVDGYDLASVKVSTLTRRESRVRRMKGQLISNDTMFQPSPGAKAGCDHVRRDTES